MSEKIIGPGVIIDFDGVKKPLSLLHISGCFLVNEPIEEIFFMNSSELYDFLNSKISRFENNSEHIQTVLEFSIKCLEKQLFPKENIRSFLSDYLKYLIQYSKISKSVMGTVMKIFDIGILTFVNGSLRADYNNQQQDIGVINFEYLMGLIENGAIKERKVTKQDSKILNFKQPPKYRPNFVINCEVNAKNTEFTIASSREKLRGGVCVEIQKGNIGQEPKFKIQIPNRIQGGASIELQFEFMEGIDFMNSFFLGSRTMDVEFKIDEVDDEWIFNEVDKKLSSLVPNYDKLNEINNKTLEIKLNERFAQYADELKIDITKTIESFPIFKDPKEFRRFIFRLTLLFTETKDSNQRFNKKLESYDDSDYILFIINSLIWYPGEYTHLFDKKYNKFLPIILNSGRSELKTLSDIINKTDSRTSFSRNKQFDVNISGSGEIELDLPTGKQGLNVKSRNSVDTKTTFNEVAKLINLILGTGEEIELWNNINKEIYYNELINNPIIESKNLLPENFRLTLDGYMSFLYSLGKELGSIVDAILAGVDNNLMSYIEKYNFKHLVEKTGFVTVSRSHQTQINYSSTQLISKGLGNAGGVHSQSMMSKVVEGDLDAFWDLLKYIKEHSVLNKIVLFGGKTLIEYLSEYEDFLRTTWLCVGNPKQDILGDSDDLSRVELGQFILDRLNLLGNTQLASSYRSTISQLRTEDGIVPVSGMQRLDKMFMKLKLCRFYENGAPDGNTWGLSGEFGSANSFSSEPPLVAEPNASSHSTSLSHIDSSGDGKVEFITQFASNYGRGGYKLMKGADGRLVIVPMFSVEN